MTPGTCYPIYNHANGSENLYRKAENYRYFLQQWQKYITPVADTLAYCLMPNHFHFLVQIKETAELAMFFESKKKLNKKNKHPSEGLEPSEGFLEKLISRQFSHLFNGYAQAYNKMYHRKGSLFIPNFKKKPITTDEYLATIVAYIHRNPIHHGFTTTMESWPYSSYTAIVKDKPSFINKKTLFDWFGGKAHLLEYHSKATIDWQGLERQFT